MEVAAVRVVVARVTVVQVAKDAQAVVVRSDTGILS